MNTLAHGTALTDTDTAAAGTVLPLGTGDLSPLPSDDTSQLLTRIAITITTTTIPTPRSTSTFRVKFTPLR